MTQTGVRLKHDLTGHPPFDFAGRKIPEGSEIVVADYDHTETESNVIFEGGTLIVDKDSLITFEEHD